jgi:thioesterase domain-containing protein
MGEAAAQYLETVCQVQPQGPWMLGGWSAGAITTYEMARQIEAAGDTALLAAFSLLAQPSEEQPASVRAEGMAELEKPWLRERFHLFCRSMTTLDGYLARPFGGRLTLFRAEGAMPPGVTDLAWGWQHLAPTDAHLIRGADHGSLLQSPALDQLVRILERAFERIEGGEGGEEGEEAWAPAAIEETVQSRG